MNFEFLAAARLAPRCLSLQPLTLFLIGVLPSGFGKTTVMSVFQAALDAALMKFSGASSPCKGVAVASGGTLPGYLSSMSDNDGCIVALFDEMFTGPGASLLEEATSETRQWMLTLLGDPAPIKLTHATKVVKTIKTPRFGGFSGVQVRVRQRRPACRWELGLLVAVDVGAGGNAAKCIRAGAKHA